MCKVKSIICLGSFFTRVKPLLSLAFKKFVKLGAFLSPYLRKNFLPLNYLHFFSVESYGKSSITQSIANECHDEALIPDLSKRATLYDLLTLA
jgi:hypothetical protein